ncbi:YjaG family protein [Hahella sp. KA22]|uniref:YjaG family protein n=1 Tax=Hahella sp. KA22 TaxID=1628392 RepID=UPI0013E32D80|nr:YjaG family protein [Hahella sp. KA22]
MASLKHFKKLESLRGWRQVVFVLSLAERATPNLKLFVESQELTLSREVKGALGALWKTVQENAKLQTLPYVEKLEEFLDQLGDIDAYGARPASDWAQLLLLGLQLWDDDKSKKAREASEISFRTVTDFVEFSEGEGLSDDDLVALWDKHPLVKDELAFHDELYAKLQELRAPTAEGLAEIRKLSRQGGVSNIGISLDG